MKKLIRILLVTSPFVTGIVNAQSVGKGGDDACSNYSQNVAAIAKALRLAGQKNVDVYDPIINVVEFSKSATRLKCEPVAFLPNELKARTHFESDGQVVTELLWNHWAGMNSETRIDLASHEMAVGLNYEQEDVYQVSRSIVEVFQSSSTWRLEKFCSSAIRNHDGTTTCTFPYVDINGSFKSFFESYDPSLNQGSSTMGICRRLGFNAVVSSIGSESLAWDFAATTTTFPYTSRIGDHGEILVTHGAKGPQHIVLSITCR